MAALLEFLGNNAVASTIIATAIVAAIGGGWRWWRNRKDSKAIYEFLRASKSGTGYAFRSTEAISSHTKISEERVAELCIKHSRIRRNEKEKQSWTLSE